jgi:TetR/AcrR family transcriptional repressor of nem operon
MAVRLAGSLEIDPENRPAHKLIAENFRGWIDAIRECLIDARLPADTDIEALATYVLALMEGGVMLSRSYGSVDPFDQTVKALQDHLQLLLKSSAATT